MREWRDGDTARLENNSKQATNIWVRRNREWHHVYTTVVGLQLSTTKIDDETIERYQRERPDGWVTFVLGSQTIPEISTDIDNPSAGYLNGVLGKYFVLGGLVRQHTPLPNGGRWTIAMDANYVKTFEELKE